jgi:thiamine-phosphate pyrophosphorylase
LIRGWARPVLCLVTDRHRAAPGESTLAGQQRALLTQVAEATDAGVDLIHVRESDLMARDLFVLVAAVVAVTRGSSSRVVVNDRVDVALAAGADGVHLRSCGPPVERVRALGPPGWLVGRSAHSPAELEAAATADYVVYGTVFLTGSKPGLPPQGLAALEAAVRQVRPPLLAIGGITAATAGDCVAAGAAGLAAISLFIRSVPGGRGPREVVPLLRAAFNAN